MPKHRRIPHDKKVSSTVPPATTGPLLPSLTSPTSPTHASIPTPPLSSGSGSAAPLHSHHVGGGGDGGEDVGSDDDVASTGARTTLGTYSTLSTLSNDGVLPYDIGAGVTTPNEVTNCHLHDETCVMNSDSAASGGGMHHHHHQHNRHQHHHPVVLTSSALLVSVPTTPISVGSSVPFPNHRSQHHNSSSVYRPVPLFSNMKLDTATHLTNAKRSTVSECMTEEAGEGLAPASPYVHTPHPKPPSLISPVVAMGTSSSPSNRIRDIITAASTTATPIPPPPPIVGQALKYQATRDWVGTAPDPSAGSGAAGALSPDSLHLSIASRTNTLIAAGFDLIGDTSPNARSGGSAWNAELEFDWGSCSPGGESSGQQQQQPGVHISTSPSGGRSNSNGGVAVGGGFTSYSRCTSALSEPTSGVGRLDENAAKFPTLPHCRPPSFSREASEQQFETGSTTSGISNNHARVRVPTIPTILAGACPDEPPEPQEDLCEEDREAILNNNRSPPLYLLNRQIQAQQLLQCYLAFSAAEKLFGSARVSFATGSGSGKGGVGADPLKRNRFLVSAAAAASAFHMFGGGALAGHPTAASLAAANFRSVFAAAAALQSSSSSMLKQQGVVPPHVATSSSVKYNNTGNSILSSILYGHSNQSQYGGSVSAAFSVPGFHNTTGSGGAAAAAAAKQRAAAGNLATGAAAVRAVPLSPDQERNTYFPQHTTTSSTAVGHVKRIEPSKLERAAHRTIAMPSSYPTSATKAAVPPITSVATPDQHGIADDNDDDDSLSDVFGGDSFDTWVSGVVLQSQGNLSNNNPTTSKSKMHHCHHQEAVDDGESSEGAVVVERPDDSSSISQQFVNQPHEKFSSSVSAAKKPFTRQGGGAPAQRVMSWNSGLSASKARTDDWDVLTPSQQQHRPSTEYDVCSVSPSAASGSHQQQHATRNATQLILGANINSTHSGAVVGRIGDLSSSTMSAVAQSTSSPIVPRRRGGAASNTDPNPNPTPPRIAPPQSGLSSGRGGCSGVGMKRVASSWASISSSGRKVAPASGGDENDTTAYASSAAVHQYHMDDF